MTNPAVLLQIRVDRVLKAALKKILATAKAAKKKKA